MLGVYPETDARRIAANPQTVTPATAPAAGAATGARTPRIKGFRLLSSNMSQEVSTTRVAVCDRSVPDAALDAVPVAAARRAAPMLRRRRLLPLAAWPLLLPAAARALEQPEGPVVLTLSGKLRLANRQQQGQALAVFDMAMLERLPQHSFTTKTPWYTAPRKFTGPLLREVLAAAGAHGSQLRAVALNDYRVDIPADDAQRFDVVVARLLDDQPMPVRNKGPLFVIYPFDSVAALRNALYYSRCAWQLKAIEVQ